jgi:hypothetical protein
MIDVSQIIDKKELSSPEQYVLSFLQEVRTEDVEIAKIGPMGERVLQVLLNIRFLIVKTLRPAFVHAHFAPCHPT